MPQKDRKKILIIGSQPKEETIYSSSLSDFALRSIDSVEQALSLLKMGGFHLIMLHDRALGKQTMQRLAQIQDFLKGRVPLILVIERGNEKIAVHANKIGITDCITKDEFIPGILTMVVRRAIEHKRWEDIYLNFSTPTQGILLKDPVTDLYNKPYLETRLREEAERCRRYRFPMTLLFCTIEQYEHILEKYGPDAVQSVVRELGHLWARNLRSSDLLARLREDKLAILLPHTSIEQSQIVWERLLTRMSEHPFTLKEENYFISVKAVAVSIHPEMPELESIIARTEEMLRDHDESSLLTLQLEN